MDVEVEQVLYALTHDIVHIRNSANILHEQGTSMQETKSIIMQLFGCMFHNTTGGRKHNTYCYILQDGSVTYVMSFRDGDDNVKSLYAAIPEPLTHERKSWVIYD